MKRAHAVVLSLSGAALLALVGVSMRRPPAAPSPGAGLQSPTAAPQVAPAVAPARAPGCSFAVGQRLAYAVSVRAEGRVSLEQLGLGKAPTLPSVQKTEATLETEVLSVDPGGAVLLGAFVPLHTSGGGEDPRLGAPFLARVDGGCALSGFGLLDSTPPSVGRIQQALLHELWWRWPAQQEIAARGDNGTGHFQGTLAAGEDAEGALIQRAIRQYVRTWRGGTGVVPERSLLTVRPGAGPWFESLSGVETLVLAGDAVTTSVEAHAVAPAAGALEKAPRELQRYAWINLLPQQPAPVREPRPVTARDLREREEIRHLTAQQSVEAYVLRVKQGVGFAQTWPQLTTWLEARPEGAAAVVGMLQEGTVVPEATAGIYVALGRARTDEAREALLDILRDKLAPAFERTRAAFALVDRDDVGPPLARELQSSSQALVSGATKEERFFAREALLALGALAGQQQSAEITAIAAEAVREALRRGHNPVTLRPALGALANVGDVSLLPDAAPFAAHPDARIREEAAIVVRRMAPGQTLDFVAGWLDREPDGQVKRELYAVLERQHVDAHERPDARLVQRAVADLRAQPSLLTRKAIVMLLGKAGAGTPEMRGALVDQARIELEANTGLYNTIAALLTPEELQQVAP